MADRDPIAEEYCAIPQAVAIVRDARDDERRKVLAKLTSDPVVREVGDALGGDLVPLTEREIARAARLMRHVVSLLDPEGEGDPCTDCDGTGIGGHGGTCPTCRGSKSSVPAPTGPYPPASPSSEPGHKTPYQRAVEATRAALDASSEPARAGDDGPLGDALGSLRVLHAGLGCASEEFTEAGRRQYAREVRGIASQVQALICEVDAVRCSTAGPTPAHEELTDHERAVLSNVRRWHAHHGGLVAADYARGSGWGGLSYDQATRALRSLVSKGLLSKPRRDYYLPTETETS